MVVIELGTADAYGNVETARLRATIGSDSAKAGGNYRKILLGDGVGQEIRGRIGFLFESCEVSGQFFGEDPKHSGGLGAGARCAYQDGDEGDFIDSDHCDSRIAGDLETCGR
jgi:hypothetical protein